MQDHFFSVCWPKLEHVACSIHSQLLPVTMVCLVCLKVTCDFQPLNCVLFERIELEKLESRIPVFIKWVPAHVGVPGNEAADTAAQQAARKVQSTHPIDGQPPLTLATSKALIRKALKERMQQQWFRVVAQKSGLDHLSRLRVDVSRSVSFFVGTRQQQTLLARLRLGTCNLNFSRARLNAGVNEECAWKMKWKGV